MQITPLPPYTTYVDAEGRQHTWCSPLHAHAVVDLAGHVLAIRPTQWEAQVVAAGLAKAQAEGVDLSQVRPC